MDLFDDLFQSNFAKSKCVAFRVKSVYVLILRYANAARTEKFYNIRIHNYKSCAFFVVRYYEIFVRCVFLCDKQKEGTIEEINDIHFRRKESVRYYFVNLLNKHR